MQTAHGMCGCHMTISTASLCNQTHSWICLMHGVKHTARHTLTVPVIPAQQARWSKVRQGETGQDGLKTATDDSSQLQAVQTGVRLCGCECTLSGGHSLSEKQRILLRAQVQPQTALQQLTALPLHPCCALCHRDWSYSNNTSNFWFATACDGLFCYCWHRSCQSYCCWSCCRCCCHNMSVCCITCISE